MFTTFMTKLKALLKSPIILLIYGILSKWYIMVVITSVMVTYWVFSGLEEAGVMEKFEDTVLTAFVEVKSVAQNCTPKILNLGDFWECLNNPPTYVRSEDEIKLEESLNDLLDYSNYDDEEDPYAEDTENKE